QGDGTPFRFTGKELDAETGLYYYGARYLDPRISRWLSVDPALGEYVPAPGQGAAKLRGVGGIFNAINMHVYHYAANNPVKYIDPDGEANSITHRGNPGHGTERWLTEDFGEDRAIRIAEANYGVDNIIKGKSFLPWWLGGDQRYHFNTNRTPESSGTLGDSRIRRAQHHLKKAINLKNKAESLGSEHRRYNRLMKRADKQFGIALHPLQDIFFHTDNVIEDICILIYHPTGQGIDNIERTESYEGARWATIRAANMYLRGVFDENDDVWNPRYLYNLWFNVNNQ
ncbi:MAG: RHS repeat-associated core domain-containing protein, partial [Treponema sp.]|nr:RHS repeat-associated core domain-containing protein [Treponema sp.]